MLAQRVKKGGIGMRNPVEMADGVHSTYFSLSCHAECVDEATCAYRQQRNEAEGGYLKDIGRAAFL